MALAIARDSCGGPGVTWNHCRHLWHAPVVPVRVRTTTSRQQPPEWLVRSQVHCFSTSEFMGVQVILNRFHPHKTRLPQRSLPVYITIE